MNTFTYFWAQNPTAST